MNNSHTHSFSSSLFDFSHVRLLLVLPLSFFFFHSSSCNVFASTFVLSLLRSRIRAVCCVLCITHISAKYVGVSLQLVVYFCFCCSYCWHILSASVLKRKILILVKVKVYSLPACIKRAVIHDDDDDDGDDVMMELRITWIYYMPELPHAHTYTRVEGEKGRKKTHRMANKKICLLDMVRRFVFFKCFSPCFLAREENDYFLRRFVAVIFLRLFALPANRFHQSTSLLSLPEKTASKWNPMNSLCVCV